MNFKLYGIGDKIEKFYLEAIKEYEKRLTRYCKTQLVVLKNEEQLLKQLTDRSYKILVSVTGEQLTSVELADKISVLGLNGISDIALIMGTDTIPHDENFALSPLNMSLGLQATVMYEQIYRSYRILNNQPYHK